MKKYVALLRGINVGGQKKVPMALLKEVLTDAGLKAVQTYIQSGNVIFESLENDKEKLQDVIYDAIKTHFGFEVPNIVFTPNHLKTIFDACPFPEEQKENSYFMILFKAPGVELVKSVETLSYPNETFVITKKAIYFYCSVGYGKAKLNNNFFERKLKVTATARNYKTMLKLLSLSTDN
ncbi:DUF1697 domain-containing protein [Cognatitamlana onchidii]|uniref:DUF1697 domain-containing protein n=1 Tax=Cognatitamlana onchidii TaxID=2562860 RepID=UPI0010A5BA76|nr:DUF1697 domain-containing protein [Algibacter onchidii]